jgi:hypothetical protein
MVREHKVSKKLAGAGSMRVMLKVSFDVPVGMTRAECQRRVFSILHNHADNSQPGAGLETSNLCVERNTGRTGHRGKRERLETRDC